MCFFKQILHKIQDERKTKIFDEIYLHLDENELKGV
jgi:hypothetical protein